MDESFVGSTPFWRGFKGKPQGTPLYHFGGFLPPKKKDETTERRGQVGMAHVERRVQPEAVNNVMSMCCLQAAPVQTSQKMLQNWLRSWCLLLQASYACISHMYTIYH